MAPGTAANRACEPFRQCLYCKESKKSKTACIPYWLISKCLRLEGPPRQTDTFNDSVVRQLSHSKNLPVHINSLRCHIEVARI